MYCENEAFQAQLSDVTIVDNRLRVMVNRDYRILSGAMMRFLQKNLQREGLYENFLSIYLKPMHLKDGNTGAPADSLMQAFTAITNSGSPD